MTPAEERFKTAVDTLCSYFEDGTDRLYPGPTAINRHLGRYPAKNTINGRECHWREQVFAERGWTRRQGRLVNGSFTRPRRMWKPPCG